MKRKILIFCISVLCSCNGQKKNQDQKNIQIEKKLKNQLQYGIFNYSNPYVFSSSDLEVILPITKAELKSRGFKFPSNDQFITKIKAVFGRTIDLKLESKYIYINFWEKCDKSFIYHPNNISDYFGIYAVKNDNYITDCYALPQIIDYQKLYPNLINYENNLPKKSIFEENGEEVSRYLWKDQKNLAQQRHNNLEILINRNKYLFNDNKASLIWLKFHDDFFLDRLVKVFGYVGDKDLLKWVLDKSLTDNEFYKLLYTKTCDNKYIFHKEVFEVMTQADDKSKKEYILYLKSRTDFPKVEDASFSDETRIYALYCYYATKFTQSVKQGDVYTFFPKLNDKKYDDELRKNNYYNIPDFKELFEDTKNGGIGLPM